MQWHQTTVANVTFIETQKDSHLQFCGEYMPQSIYLNDIDYPDGTQGITNCLKG